MPKRIPITAAKAVAKQFDLKQVILLAWDGELTHVVTYGASAEDCDQAAQGGDKIKEALGWTDVVPSLPSRVKALTERVAELEAELEAAQSMDRNADE